MATDNAQTGAKVLRVIWRHSAIGYPVRQKRTLKALGFSRLGQTVELPDNPAVRGMVAKVTHLVEVLEA